MDRIGLIEGLDEVKVRATLNVMLRDKGHEFQELAKTLKIPETTDDWQVIVLKFCLDFEDCLNIWTDSEEPSSIKNTKCMTIMRELAKGKKNFSEIINMQNVAQTLFSEFHETYKRVA
jgi:hypothetical protein